MSPKPIRIAQISDLHIKPPGSLAYGRVDTAKALERCVVALNEFDPAPDFVVISGDLADTPTAEEYQYLKRLLAPLKLPFAGIPGNHDSREVMREAFAGHAGIGTDGPFLNITGETGGLRLIGLDTTIPGRIEGTLCEDRLAWLDARLSEAPQQPALVFMHHPPFETGLTRMDGWRCGNPAIAGRNRLTQC